MGIEVNKNTEKLMNAALLKMFPGIPEMIEERYKNKIKAINEAMGPHTLNKRFCLEVADGNSSEFATRHSPEKAMVR